MDPLAEKYYALSPFANVANNPIKLIDVDGRDIVDPKGNTVRITAAKNGTLTFSSNATPSIIRVANALSITSTGRQQLNNLIKSDIKVRINITESSKIEKRGDSKTVYTFGETVQGNYNESDNFGRYQNEDGTFGTKESTITIYEGTIKEGVKEGSGLKLEGLTLDQAIGAISGHESLHATNKSEINKDIVAQQKGKNRPASEREAKPEAVEKKIIEESKKLNQL